MTAAILQLQATGEEDVYLTQSPETNIFKYRYSRYHNFATNVFEIHLNEVASFGKKTTVIVPFNGDLLSKLHLSITLPVLEKVDGTYACWVDTMGYAMFDGAIEFELNGVIVDRLYSECMDMQTELTNVKPGFDVTILKSDVYRSTLYNAEKVVEMFIPLPFWFSKHYSSSLPLASMTNHDEMKINFTFRPFEQVIHYDGNSPPLFADIIDSNLVAEYIYLDDTLVNAMQKQKQTYIIDQMKFNGLETIQASNQFHTTSIDIDSSCKELLFAAVDISNINNNNWLNYSLTGINGVDTGPLISEVGVFLDNKQRFNDDFLSESVFRTYYPSLVHSKIPTKHMYCVPFALRPEIQQPTGSLNLSRFNNVSLTLKMVADNPMAYLYVFGITYNVLVIENGRIEFLFMT